MIMTFSWHVLDMFIVHDMFLTCSWHVHDMFMTCSWHVHDMFMTCSWHFHEMFMTCSWHFHEMYTTCPWNAHHMFTTCSWHVHDMFMTCSWHFHDMFMTCSWHVHDMFMTCSWHVHDIRPKKCCNDSVPCLSKKFSMMPSDRFENSARWHILIFLLEFFSAQKTCIGPKTILSVERSVCWRVGPMSVDPIYLPPNGSTK